MYKLVPSFILLLLSSVMAFGQYANIPNVLLLGLVVMPFV